MRPLAGSTTSDVRRPVGFADVNTALYAPATSCTLPRSTRWSRPTLPERTVVLVGALLVGEELLVGVSGGPFERRLELIEPDALEVRMPPRGLRHSAVLSACARHGRGGLQNQSHTCYRRRCTQRLDKSSPHLKPPCCRIPLHAAMFVASATGALSGIRHVGLPRQAAP